MPTLIDLKKELRKSQDPEKAAFFPGFFRASYLVNDKFLGVTVPKQRVVAKEYYKKLSLEQVFELLHSEWHEERLTALLMLVLKFQKADEKERTQIIAAYLRHLGPSHSNILKNIRMTTEVSACKLCREDENYGVNNWDLVDSSAYSLLGVWLLGKDRAMLYELAKSDNVWERRVAIVATMAFIRKGEIEDTFRIAKLLIRDKEDYIHKAVGWLLREAGKKALAKLESFLNENAAIMPRTMLRYAIERLPVDRRQHYLAAKK